MKRVMMAVAAALAATAAYATDESTLQIEFQEWRADGKHALYDMPVTITDMKGRIVYEGAAKGPEFRASLPKGRYTVTTKWDDWTFTRDVVVDGKSAEPIVFAWDTPSASASPIA